MWEQSSRLVWSSPLFPSLGWDFPLVSNQCVSSTWCSYLDFSRLWSCPEAAWVGSSSDSNSTRRFCRFAGGTHIVLGSRLAWTVFYWGCLTRLERRPVQVVHVVSVVLPEVPIPSLAADQLDSLSWGRKKWNDSQTCCLKILGRRRAEEISTGYCWGRVIFHFPFTAPCKACYVKWWCEYWMMRVWRLEAFTRECLVNISVIATILHFPFTAPCKVCHVKFSESIRFSPGRIYDVIFISNACNNSYVDSLLPLLRRGSNMLISLVIVGRGWASLDVEDGLVMKRTGILQQYHRKWAGAGGTQEDENSSTRSTNASSIGLSFMGRRTPVGNIWPSFS